MSVDSVSSAVAAMETARKLPRTLLGGTPAMREAGQVFLPREPKETEAAYKVRLNRSFLFNGYAKAIKDMSGKVFAKEIEFGDDMPDDLKAYAENIDMAGQNIHVFSKGVFDTGLAEGISYILVDMPPMLTDEEGNPVTLNRREASERRPWVAHIMPDQVLGWRSENINGAEILTQFRFRESVSEPDGPYGETIIEQIRVYIREGDAVRWEIHRREGQSQQWMIHDEGNLSISEIPVTPFYTERTGFFQGKPPLANLADVNHAHWQSQSDQRNILHVARVPILFAAGLNHDDDVSIGVNHMLTAQDSNAKVEYVEHSGRAIESGRQDLKDLEFQMQTLGLELILETEKTATGERRDEDKVLSPLAMYALSLKDALENVFRLFGMFMGRDDAGSIVINTDFGISSNDANDVSNIIQAANGGIISKETAIRELQRRDFLSGDYTAEDEIDRLKNEGFDDDEEFDSTMASVHASNISSNLTVTE